MCSQILGQSTTFNEVQPPTEIPQENWLTDPQELLFYLSSGTSFQHYLDRRTHARSENHNLPTFLLFGYVFLTPDNTFQVLWPEFGNYCKLISDEEAVIWRKDIKSGYYYDFHHPDLSLIDFDLIPLPADLNSWVCKYCSQPISLENFRLHQVTFENEQKVTSSSEPTLEMCHLECQHENLHQRADASVQALFAGFNLFHTYKPSFHPHQPEHVLQYSASAETINGNQVTVDYCSGYSHSFPKIDLTMKFKTRFLDISLLNHLHFKKDITSDRVCLRADAQGCFLIQPLSHQPKTIQVSSTPFSFPQKLIRYLDPPFTLKIQRLDPKTARDILQCWQDSKLLAPKKPHQRRFFWRCGWKFHV